MEGGLRTEDLHRRGVRKAGKERICILVYREKSSGDSDGGSDPADYSNRYQWLRQNGEKIGGVALNPDKLAISEEAEISGTGY